jgi:hypothetical protein
MPRSSNGRSPTQSYILNPICLQPIPIPKKIEDETAEVEMELYLAEFIELFCDLDALNEDEEEKQN